MHVSVLACTARHAGILKVRTAPGMTTPRAFLKYLFVGPCKLVKSFSRACSGPAVCVAGLFDLPV